MNYFNDMEKNIKVYINNKPATFDNCHSEMEVKNNDEYSAYEMALGLLWYMAKKQNPEHAMFFIGLDGWLNNRQMETANMPEKFQPIVAQWAVWFEHCTPVNGNPFEGLEDLIVNALNSKYDEIMDYSDNDPQEFIKELTHYARRWARDCYQSAEHVY